MERSTLKAGAQLPRLLIVDDEPAQMRALCATLEAEGYVTAGFTAPREALEFSASHPFDLVLTDLSMPDIDGLQFLAMIRQRDPDAICIVMTGHGTIDTAVAAMKAGALDYILKPFTLRMILPVLQRAYCIRQLRIENDTLRERESMTRNLNALLERTVQDRTAELVRANRELEAFSHSVSHDLRSPLRAIEGYVQLIGDEFGAMLPPEANNYLERVRGSVAKMQGLIEDFLRLSHVTAAELIRTRVDLSKMVTEIVSSLQAVETTRSVQIDVQPDVMCDAEPKLMRIAFENLLGNAWKFTQRTSNARIEFGQITGEPTYYVRDNGAGFDPARHQELFVPFRRLHDGQEFPGSGLGLSIVDRIARRHGGCAWADGQVGSGATFYMRIPPAHTSHTE